MADERVGSMADEEPVGSLADEEPPVGEDVEVEVELLRAMYEEGELTVRNRDVACLLHPRTGEEQNQRFVRAKIRARLPIGYPNAPPELDIQESRGLLQPEETKLLAHLKSVAAEHTGCVCLHALFDAAQDLLTDINKEGDCAICLEKLFLDDDARIFLAPCFHSFHVKCIGHWWHVYEPAKKANTESRPAEVDAAAAAAKATLSEVHVLRNKLDCTVASIEQLQRRLESLSAQEEPAPSMIRRAEEELSSAQAEEKSLKSRVKRSEKRASEADEYARRTDSEHATCRCAEPLPCPVCRMPISSDVLEASCVKAEPPPQETRPQHVAPQTADTKSVSTGKHILDRARGMHKIAPEPRNAPEPRKKPPVAVRDNENTSVVNEGHPNEPTRALKPGGSSTDGKNRRRRGRRKGTSASDVQQGQFVPHQ